MESHWIESASWRTFNLIYDNEKKLNDGATLVWAGGQIIHVITMSSIEFDF